MNLKLKYLLIFLGGAAVGAIITNRLLQQHYEAIAEEEVHLVKEYYFNQEGYSAKPTAFAVETTEMPSAANIDYHNISHAGRKAPQEDAEVTAPSSVVSKEGDEQELIRIISYEEFFDKSSDNDWEVISLGWYYVDSVLVDNDTIIADPEKTIGRTAARKLVTDPDLNLLYVRDEQNYVDYEIVIFNEGYEEATQIRQADSDPRDEEWQSETGFDADEGGTDE